MKIIHVITDLKQGGAQKILYKIITENNSDSEHIIISLIGSGHYKEILEQLEIRFYTLGMSNKSLNLKKLWKIYKILRLEKPDTVQTWMYHCDLIGGVIARIAGIKNIFWGVVSFNLSADVMKLTSRIIIKINAALSYIIPSKIIYCAKSSIKVHEDIGFDKQKSIFIPIGFDVKHSLNKMYNKKENTTFTIGCIARWDPQKDHHNLLKALKILDDNQISYKCILASIGMDNTNPELISLIEKVGVDKNKLELRGYVRDINSLINKLDLNILASAGEAFPNIIGETMSLGVLSIGTKVGDIPQIIGNNGWVIDKSDSKLLAKTIIQAKKEFMNKDKWRQKCFEARERIEKNYPVKKMIDEYYSIWRIIN